MLLDPVLTGETAALLARYETEPEHTRHVAHLALELFDQLQHWHGLSDRDRQLLECAAVLHDIGWALSHPTGSGHHKATARLIREQKWGGLQPDEVEIVAETARYHRKSLPDLEHHADYARLEESQRLRVNYLAAFLRIADGLDRRHVQRVDHVTSYFTPSGLLITAQSAVEITVELSAAEKKADLLRRLIPVGIHFQARTGAPA